MKLEERSNKEITIGTKEEQSFGIATDNPQLYEILRNKMYSHPIESICREVASNARDANREAGRADAPVVIEITSQEETNTRTISFKDFGLGISPDKMSNVFLIYGQSDKTNTNALTGGFGLGAKTPFSYSDQFIVDTTVVVQGVKINYVYSAIIDSTGIGKMITISQKETDASTGTKIIIPIKGNDYIDFVRGIEKSLGTWDNLQTIGFSIPKDRRYLPIIKWILRAS